VNNPLAVLASKRLPAPKKLPPVLIAEIQKEAQLSAALRSDAPSMAVLGKRERSPYLQKLALFLELVLKYPVLKSPFLKSRQISAEQNDPPEQDASLERDDAMGLFR
jgi:hypothetical protein